MTQIRTRRENGQIHPPPVHMRPKWMQNDFHFTVCRLIPLDFFKVLNRQKPKLRIIPCHLKLTPGEKQRREDRIREDVWVRNEMWRRGEKILPLKGKSFSISNFFFMFSYQNIRLREQRWKENLAVVSHLPSRVLLQATMPALSSLFLFNSLSVWNAGFLKTFMCIQTFPNTQERNDTVKTSY